MNTSFPLLAYLSAMVVTKYAFHTAFTQLKRQEITIQERGFYISHYFKAGEWILPCM
jgi:hypothetical protein